jgi:hypothetical protein
MCNHVGGVVPYGSHLMLLAPSGAGWEPWGWGRSREALCTFGAIVASLFPHWALLWRRNAGVGLPQARIITNYRKTYSEYD